MSWYRLIYVLLTPDAFWNRQQANPDLFRNRKYDQITFWFVSGKVSKGLEKWMKGSDFVFDFVGGLSYKSRKIALNPGSDIRNPEKLWKNAIINPQDCSNTCFKYAVTVMLNHKNIKKHPERISQIRITYTNTIKERKKIPRIKRL